MNIQTSALYVTLRILWKSATLRSLFYKAIDILYKIPPLKRKAYRLHIQTTYGLYLIYTTKLIEKLIETLKIREW